MHWYKDSSRRKMGSRGKMMVDLCRKSINTEIIQLLQQPMHVLYPSTESNEFDNFDIENCPVEIINDNNNIVTEPLFAEPPLVNDQFESNETSENVNTDMITITPLELNNVGEEVNVYVVNNFEIEVRSENNPENLQDPDYVPTDSDSNSDSGSHLYKTFAYELNF